MSGISPIIEHIDSQHSGYSKPEENSIDSLNTDTSVINGLEELVMKDEKNKKAILHRIESEKSALTETEAAVLDERVHLESVDSSSRTFSILSREVWECLRGYYGGGPAIPRLINYVTTKSTIERDEIRTTRDLNSMRTSYDTIGEKGYWIDINPLCLHLFICDCAGNPIPVPRETIVGRNESAELFITRTIATYIQSSHLLEKYSTDSSNEILTQKFFEHNYSDMLLQSDTNSKSLSYLSNVLRFWVLIYHNALDINLDDDSSSNPLSSRHQPEESR